MSIAAKDYGVVVIARDESSNIEECLKAILNTDDTAVMVVVDSRTTDNTAEIARRFTPRVSVIDGNRGHLRNVGYRDLDLPYEAHSRLCGGSAQNDGRRFAAGNRWRCAGAKG
jgi:glycosyltransferase involved in cell wall biosynthesis